MVRKWLLLTRRLRLLRCLSHASAALSYADGLAKAFELTGHRNRHVVAVVGDGALTGGSYRVRRTAGGDAWERAQGEPTGKPAVSLGMPQVGAPTPSPSGPTTPACGT